MRPHHLVARGHPRGAFSWSFAALLVSARCFAAEDGQEPRLVSDGLWGYISMDVPAPPDDHGYGVSLYSTAWPLVERPLRDFQIGLASIWIVPENRKVEEPLLPVGTVARDNWPERGPSYRDVFQTIEGGLGFWASTRFGSATAKFRMNGTADGYSHEISSPGWGFGDTSALPPDQMGIAQLSPRLLVPPDGLTFQEGTCGDLFGYAWMVLPLTAPKGAGPGSTVPTGDQSWTLFIHSRDFKGPVAFYTPVTWSRISRRHPPAVGRGLDARPGLVTGGAIEVNTVPRLLGRDGKGAEFSRIPRLQFPADGGGRTVLIHDLTHYSKEALYRQVERWLAGGEEASGKFDPKGAIVPPCTARRLDVRQGPEKTPIRGCEGWVETRAFDRSTFGLAWKPLALSPWTGSWRRGAFPEFCRRDGRELEAIAAVAVPPETGLAEARFRPAEDSRSYTSPENEDGPWKRPGPKAGPFQAALSDGSVVTYWWYRFIDQPSLQEAGLSEAEKESLQAAVEKIHARWTPDREYLPPPRMGALAALDPALVVTPPAGLEVGHVPIATRQSPGTASEGRPVKVFVLAGQSNMEGKAKVALLERQAGRPATRDIFKHLRKDGKWVERDDVWIKFLDRKGKLTIGYGSPGCIGPELEFGNAAGDRFEEPVLLIKAAWGGRSLWRDFRPPSAGLPPRAAMEKLLSEERKRRPEASMEDIEKGFGASYRAMLEEVNSTLAGLGSRFPAYRGQGWEISGFIWFQGWNDMIDAEATAEYAANLERFIRDVRKDLRSPGLPFVIGQMGVGGPDPDANVKRFKEAQAKVMAVEQFRGNVALVKTDAFWDREADGVFRKGWREHLEEWNEVGSDWPYHYLGSVRTMCAIGRAFAEAALDLREREGKR